MTFKLGPTSILRLQQVHPDLVKVVERAIVVSEIDFTVLEGARTKERQVELLAAGATTTLNSRHIPGASGASGAGGGGGAGGGCGGGTNINGNPGVSPGPGGPGLVIVEW